VVLGLAEAEGQSFVWFRKVPNDNIDTVISI
jgi:hypothetical protein